MSEDLLEGAILKSIEPHVVGVHEVDSLQPVQLVHLEDALKDEGVGPFRIVEDLPAHVQVVHVGYDGASFVAGEVDEARLAVVDALAPQVGDVSLADVAEPRPGEGLGGDDIAIKPEEGLGIPCRIVEGEDFGAKLQCIQAVVVSLGGLPILVRVRSAEGGESFHVFKALHGDGPVVT